MKINDEFKNIVCPDCGNKDKNKFHIVIDFGKEIGEVKFGCMKCYEMFILDYDELKNKRIKDE